MKKAVMIALIAAILIPAASFAADKKIVIGVTPFPAKDIAAVAKEVLKKDGYELVIKEFTDFVQPNYALQDKDLAFFDNSDWRTDTVSQITSTGNTAEVWRNDGNIAHIAFQFFLVDIFCQNRCRCQMIHRNIKKSFDLACMKIHRNHTGNAGFTH